MHAAKKVQIKHFCFLFCEDLCVHCWNDIFVSSILTIIMVCFMSSQHQLSQIKSTKTTADFTPLHLISGLTKRAFVIFSKCNNKHVTLIWINITIVLRFCDFALWINLTKLSSHFDANTCRISGAELMIDSFLNINYITANYNKSFQFLSVIAAGVRAGGSGETGVFHRRPQGPEGLHFAVLKLGY